MSAPTPKWSDDHTLAVIAGDLATEWPATPADARLWLLDQGATEQQWCAQHESVWLNDDVGCEAVLAAQVKAWRPGNECRMVSVLVWKP